MATEVSVQGVTKTKYYFKATLISLKYAKEKLFFLGLELQHFSHYLTLCYNLTMRCSSPLASRLHQRQSSAL